MEIGIGLPAAVPGVKGDDVLEWSRRAEEHGFSSLGTLDRLVYPNYEPLIALGAAAAVTERIRLTTDILIVPYRANAALLAKQTATLHDLSGGRLVLGVALGAREDDYEASGVPLQDRGQRFEAMLNEMQRIWRGDSVAGAPVGPPLERPPQLVIGGSGDPAIQRSVTVGDGWTMGGGTPDQFREGAKRVRTAWEEAGRDGDPRLITLAYFALGEGAEDAARADLLHYYAWLGEEIAEQIAASAATDAQTVAQYAHAFADAGADELIFFPTKTDVDQVDLLAEAVV